MKTQSITGTAALFLAAGALSAQEPTVRAYLEPSEVEVGEQFKLIVEISGVTEVEELALPDRFPFAVPVSDHRRPDITDVFPPDPGDVLPYTFEITPATGQSPATVTISYALVAQDDGVFEFTPFRITAGGLALETEPVMLFVRPRTGPAAPRAWVEPQEVKLMERFTLFVDGPRSALLNGRKDLPDLSGFAARNGASGAWSPRRPEFHQFVALRAGTHEIGSVTVRVAGEVLETEPVTLVVSEEHGEIEAHAGVNTGQAWVGGEFVLVVEVTGAREFDEDPVLPDMSAFAERQRSGSGGWGWVTASREYHFRALRPGELEIGPVTVRAAGRTVRTAPVQLTIAEGPPDPVAVPEDLRTTVAADRRRVYVGEPVLVSYQLLARDGFGFERWSVFEGTDFIPPEHQDFQVHDLGDRSGGWRRVSVDDRAYRPDAEHLVALVPLETGEKTVDPAEFRVQVNRHYRPGSADPSDRTRAQMVGEWTPMTLTTDPIAIEVVPLPAEGRPESFRGHVGRVEVTSWVDRTEAEVGDTVTLRVRMTGDAYLRLMPEPGIILPEGFDISAPVVSEDPRRFEVGVPGVRTLVYRLVPRREGPLPDPWCGGGLVRPGQRRVRRVARRALRHHRWPGGRGVRQ